MQRNQNKQTQAQKLSTRKSKQNKKSQMSVVLRKHPPSLNNYEIGHSQTLRFITNAAISSAFTFQNLLDTLLIATSATAVYDLFHVVKLRGIKVWSIVAQGTTETVEVVFSGSTAGSQGNERIITDTSLGIEPAFVSARPDVRTLSGSWQLSSTAIAFSLVCGANSIVDVDLSYRNIPGSAVLAQNVGVAANIGAQYYRGLDGLAIAASKFNVPTGIATI